MDSGCVEIVTNSAEETLDVGRALGAVAQPGDVFLLVGELGAGKTTLTQGVLWGLGGDEYARSPTFVMVSQYEGRLTLHHIDLFRLGSPQEAYDLGLDEYLYGDGLCVVEWADRAPGQLPEDHLSIRMERLGETKRRLSLLSEDAGYERHLSAVRAGVIG